MSAGEMKLVHACAPELVRSAQKDRFYASYLGKLFSDISRPLLSQRKWLAWQRELQLLAELLYYGLTTCAGNQTLGEEYCNTIQVVPRNGSQQYSVPGVLRRTLSILVQVFGQYVTEKLLRWLSNHVANHSLPIPLNPSHYCVLEQTVKWLDEAVTVANQLHLALFYVYGTYYYISKRLSGIRHLMVYYNSLAPPSSPYKLLGWLVLLQLVMKLIQWLMKWQGSAQLFASPVPFRGQTGKSSSDAETVGSSRVEIGIRCLLCLENCSAATATPCGHVFCWKCVVEWSNEKSECPVCRNKIEPQLLVVLQHFDTDN